MVQEIFSRLVGGVEDGLLGGVGNGGLAVDLGDHVDEDGGALSDALHLLQVLHRGVEDRGEGAVALHQSVSDGIGVPPGDGVIEQQLQGLVGRKALQAAGEEPLTHFLSVTVVNAHGTPPFREIFNKVLYHGAESSTSSFRNREMREKWLTEEYFWHNIKSG